MTGLPDYRIGVLTNLAFHRADVLPDVDDLTSLRAEVGFTVIRGLAKIIVDGRPELTVPITDIEEIDKGRLYRLTGPGVVWLVRRSGGGCQSCGQSQIWPFPT